MKLDRGLRWPKAALEWLPAARPGHESRPREASPVSRFADRNLFVDAAEKDLELSMGRLPAGAFPEAEAIIQLRAELEAAGLGGELPSVLTRVDV